MEPRDLDKANALSSKLSVIRSVIDNWSKLTPLGPSTIGHGNGSADVQVVDTKAWLAMRAALVELMEEQYERTAAERAAL